jgi:hypothetical protein
VLTRLRDRVADGRHHLDLRLQHFSDDAIAELALRPREKSLVELAHGKPGLRVENEELFFDPDGVRALRHGRHNDSLLLKFRAL